MVAMSRIHAMSCETAHKKKIGTFVRRNTDKGSVISEPPLNSYHSRTGTCTRMWLFLCSYGPHPFSSFILYADAMPMMRVYEDKQFPYNHQL